MSLAVLLLAALPAAAPGLPELPKVPLSELPAAVRERVAEAYRRAQEHPATAAAAGELAMLLHAYDQVGLAEAAYVRARALEPASFEWAYLSGLVLLRLGRQEAAIAALREAVALQPRAVAARVRLAEALLAAADVGGAAAQFRSLREDRPSLPQPHYGLGRVEAARGNAAAAAGHFEEACHLFEPYGAAHYGLALAYRDLGRDEDSRRHLQLYERHRLSAPPLDDPALERVLRLKTGAGAHLSEGVRLAGASDLEGAVREHLKALELDGQLAQAHANLVSLFGRLRRWNEAEEHYRAAIALAPGRAEAHYDYGVLLAEQGRRAEAAEAFGKALALSPRYAAAHHNLGLLLEAQGRVEDAAAHYRQAAAHQAGYRAARFNLGRALVALGRPREAAAELRQILTPEDSETPRYLFALAAALVRAGEREEGLAYARQARDKAEALGQTALVASIERDIRALEGSRPPR
jgi:tetratricopeptide (TPR) repeat protein